MKISRNQMLPCLAVGFALLLCVTDAMAQPGGRGGRRGGPGGAGPAGGRMGAAGRMGGGGSQFLLRREDVRKDLELSDEQIEQLEKLSEGREPIDREALRSELEGLSDDQRIEKMRERREETAKENDEKLREILLPHQMERLKQITAQLSAQGGSRSLTGGRLADQLGITDEQKEKIRIKSEELQKSLTEKIAALRKEMQEELLAELTPEQRAQYQEMMGDEFKFEQPRRAGQAQGVGGRGAGGGRAGGARGAGGARRPGGRRGGNPSGDRPSGEPPVRDGNEF